MPIEISVHQDPDYNLVRYDGDIVAADIDQLIRTMESGEISPVVDLVHDMSRAQSFELPGAEASKLGFRRQATMQVDTTKQIRAAMVGASPGIEETLKVWRAMFLGDETRYILRSFSEIEPAIAWLKT